MSERYIEDEFLHDPRVRQFEVRKRSKRWYWYKQTIEAIKEIIQSDWIKNLDWRCYQLNLHKKSLHPLLGEGIINKNITSKL